MKRAETKLAKKTRGRLGPAPELAEWPLVSIVVLNRDGAGLLRRLLAGLVERTDYPTLELIIVDNASSDDSLGFIRAAEAPFPISILANHHNESFSDGCNQGAGAASGELLLFLNNDAEPFEPGWLRELVACLLGRPDAGAAGPTLIAPGESSGAAATYMVRSRRTRFRGDREHLSPDQSESRRELFDEGFGEDADSTFAVGACILIERELFEEVGGFTHGYFYGGEDTDLFLKLNARSLRFYYSGRSVLIHGGNATRRREFSDGEMQSIGQRNADLLMRHWGARLLREYELDRLAGNGHWAVPGEDLPGARSREEVLALAFCLKANGVSDHEAPELSELDAELSRRGHRCLLLRDDTIDDPRGFDYDIVVHLRGPARYAPNPAQLNVLWPVGAPPPGLEVECGRYDLVVTADAELAARLRRCESNTPVRVLDRARPAHDLIDAAFARAEEIDLPIRLGI